VDHHRPNKTRPGRQRKEVTVAGPDRAESILHLLLSLVAASPRCVLWRPITGSPTALCHPDATPCHGSRHASDLNKTPVSIDLPRRHGSSPLEASMFEVQGSTVRGSRFGLTRLSTFSLSGFTGFSRTPVLRFTFYVLRLTAHVSRFTFHVLRFTAHYRFLAVRKESI
jgi:hypothetical protein